MLIKLTYFKRGTIASGREVNGVFDVAILPRVGEYIWLGEFKADGIEMFDPTGMAVCAVADRRYVVQSVEHKLDGREPPVYHVAITTLER